MHVVYPFLRHIIQENHKLPVCVRYCYYDVFFICVGTKFIVSSKTSPLKQ